MVMDYLRSGYHARMRFWEERPPVDIVWFRAPKEAKVFTEKSIFRSLNWVSPTTNAGIGEQRPYDPDTCPPTIHGPWYRGNAPAKYTGQSFCGSLQAFRIGGTDATPVIHTDSQGRCPSCDTPTQIMSGGIGFGTTACDFSFVGAMEVPEFSLPGSYTSHFAYEVGDLAVVITGNVDSADIPTVTGDHPWVLAGSFRATAPSIAVWFQRITTSGTLTFTITGDVFLGPLATGFGVRGLSNPVAACFAHGYGNRPLLESFPNYRPALAYFLGAAISDAYAVAVPFPGMEGALISPPTALLQISDQFGQFFTETGRRIKRSGGTSPGNWTTMPIWMYCTATAAQGGGSLLRQRMTGGLRFGGTAKQHPTIHQHMTGGIKLGGSSLQVVGRHQSMTGGLKVGGSSGQFGAEILVMSGGLRVGGSAAQHGGDALNLRMTGGLRVGGSSMQGSPNGIVGSGGVLLGGTAVQAFGGNVITTMSGGFVVGGTAAQVSGDLAPFVANSGTVFDQVGALVINWSGVASPGTQVVVAFVTDEATAPPAPSGSGWSTQVSQLTGGSAAGGWLTVWQHDGPTLPASTTFSTTDGVSLCNAVWAIVSNSLDTSAENGTGSGSGGLASAPSITNPGVVQIGFAAYSFALPNTLGALFTYTSFAVAGSASNYAVALYWVERIPGGSTGTFDSTLFFTADWASGTVAFN